MKKLRVFLNDKIFELGIEEVEEGQEKATMVVEKPKVIPKASENPKIEIQTSSNDESIEAPMPGRIADVLVKVGQRIQEGDVLMILEAMKLENEVCSERAGVVKEIRVKSEDMVEAGDIVAVIG
mgnify:CR=1 FL=1